MFNTPYMKKPPVVKTEIIGESMTKQHHQDECDINQILAKYQKTGNIAHANANEGRYQDYGPDDLLTAINIVKDARNMFDDLPSSTRKHFDNDPVKFFEFIQDPNKIEESIEMGLRKPTIPDEVIQKVKIVEDEKPSNIVEKTTKTE